MLGGLHRGAELNADVSVVLRYQVHIIRDNISITGIACRASIHRVAIVCLLITGVSKHFRKAFATPTGIRFTTAITALINRMLRHEHPKFLLGVFSRDVSMDSAVEDVIRCKVIGKADDWI